MHSNIKKIINALIKEEVSKLFLESDRDEYHGGHEAPTKDDSPMWNVSLNGSYPEDFYSNDGARWYATEEGGIYCYSIVKSAYNKPNKPVKIYRAIPAPSKTNEEQLWDLEMQKKYILKHGKIPNNANPAWAKGKTKSEYYDFIHDKIEELKLLPPSPPKEKPNFNPGDWITIYRPYAVEHAKALGATTAFKIISKTVPAKQLFTDGNSILEWGWNP